MDYVYLMIGRQEYEERVHWLRSLYGRANQSNQPGRVQRLLSHLLSVMGRLLVSLGERMQQPRHDVPTPAPVTK